MKITNYVLPQKYVKHLGLEEIEMNNLGKYVVLAGKNGAGKTRVLNSIKDAVSIKNTIDSNKMECESLIKSSKNQLKNNQNNTTNRDTYSSEIPYEETLESVIESLENDLEVINKANIKFDKPNQIDFIEFIPKNLDLNDAHDFSLNIQLKHYSEITSNKIDNLNITCTSYLQLVQNKYFEATSKSTSLSIDEINKAKRQYRSLKKLFDQILETDIKRDINTKLMIFEKPIAEAQLSSGQKILLQLIVALHANNTNLSNAILILDEPENHLHPSILIDFFQALEKVAPSSQFWIATHSVPLLAHLANIDSACIWYVNKNKVNRTKSNPEEVLTSLLGDEEQILKLRNFINLPSKYAATKFAGECLLSPNTVMTDADDPQLTQIYDFLKYAENDKLSLLDYGAGKCRLIAGLNSIDSDHESFANRVDYYAFDPSDKDSDYGSKLLSDIYQSDSQRYFNKPEDFFKTKSNNSIDVVVLCNVLHEISPSYWMDIFSKNSLIYKCLNDNGYLLIVEDQELPIGEVAHEYGFILFDTEQLEILFNFSSSNGDPVRISNLGNKNRFKAHYIPKKFLENISEDSIKNSIENLRNHSLHKIKLLRNKDHSYKNGLQNALWTQTFANTSLYLDDRLRRIGKN